MHDGNSNNDGGIMQDGGHTLNNRLTETCSLGLPCTFLYMTSCYEQLTPSNQVIC